MAGVMGTWCFVKDDAQSCCLPAVTGLLYQSLAYSFGSICLESLLQPLVTALYGLFGNLQRGHFNSNSVRCGLALCCVVKLYVNQWAYVLVGING